MKKILVMLIMCLLLMGGTAIAEPKVYICDTNSGATMGVTDSIAGGVSLIGIVNIIADNIIEEDYSIQLGTLTFGYGNTTDAAKSGVSSNADPGGTGLTVDTASGVTLRYGVSNTHLTEAQWIAKLTTGTTQICIHTVGSGSSIEPVEFAPEPSSQLAIFIQSGLSQFLVPKVYLFAR